MWRDRLGAVVVVTATMLAVGGIAFAHPYLPLTLSTDLGLGVHAAHEDGVVDFELDPANQALVFSFPDESGDPDCSGVTVQLDGDGRPMLVEEVIGCHVVSVLGPQGQANHGAAVWNVVHYLKNGELDLGDTPPGHVVREIARSNIGKPDAATAAATAVVEQGSEGEGKGPPDHAPAHGRRR